LEVKNNKKIKKLKRRKIMLFRYWKRKNGEKRDTSKLKR
jgi:hypothetical protein